MLFVERATPPSTSVSVSFCPSAEQAPAGGVTSAVAAVWPAAHVTVCRESSRPSGPETTSVTFVATAASASSRLRFTVTFFVPFSNSRRSPSPSGSARMPPAYCGSGDHFAKAFSIRAATVVTRPGIDLSVRDFVPQKSSPV